MRSPRISLFFAVLWCALIGGSIVAHAGEPGGAGDPGPEFEKGKDDRKYGWSPFLQFGAVLSVSGSNGAIGQTDGNSLSAGLTLLGRLNYLTRAWDWRNTLSISEVVARTPLIDEFTKANDKLSFETVLHWTLRDWVGPFASALLETPLFKGLDVRPSDVDYTLDGVVVATQTNRYRLTESFQPLTLKQTLGAYLRPIHDKRVEVMFKAGLGANETLAKGARIVDDAPATTGVVELAALDDVVQAGVVTRVESHGLIDDSRVTYAAHAEVMLPVVNDDPQDRPALELVNVDIGAKLGIKIFDWASFDYELKVIRQSQLLDAWQIQHSLLLTFSFTPIQADPPSP
jgi:hypothetical protein